jgi:hypothetical protein
MKRGERIFHLKEVGTYLYDTMHPPSGIRRKASDQWRRKIPKRI